MLFCAEMYPSKMSGSVSWVQSLPFLCHRITGHLSYDTRVSEGCNRIRFLVVTATGTERRLPTPQEILGEFDSVVIANDHHFVTWLCYLPVFPNYVGLRISVDESRWNVPIHRAKHVRCNSEKLSHPRQNQVRHPKGDRHWVRDT